MRLRFLLLCQSVVILFAAGCNNTPPLEARYTSKDTVLVSYQDKQYTLNRWVPNPSVPFAYSFERDGDLNLIIDGEEYDIESPYDREKKKSTDKKVKKKTKVKKKKNK